jgi:hypothetical protein
MQAIILTMVVFMNATTVYTVSERVTPYGDYTHSISAYGICKENISPGDAEIAIERYFAGRGLRALHIQHRGRFVEADIYRDNTLLDKVLFDRKTGRIRSIY